jgi:hypothetical protein
VKAPPHTHQANVSSQVVARLQGDDHEGAYLRFYAHRGFEPDEIDEGRVGSDVAAELSALGWTWRKMIAYDQGATERLAHQRRLAIAIALELLDQ